MGPVSERVVDRIFSDIIRRYIDSREELRARYRAEGKTLLFVHELCECSRKREMRRRFPEIERAEAYNPRFAVGQLIEEALKERFQDGEEHEYTRELVVEGRPYVIGGTIDVVDPEKGTPIEVKYQTSLMESPYEHHVLQLRAYLWLAGARRGELLYVSPEGLKSFIVREPLTDGEVARLIKEDKAPRWPEWECYYCPYQQFCSKSNCRHRKPSTFR